MSGYPRVVLELDEALTQDLVERLHSGTLDVILAPGRVPGYSSTAQPLGTVVFAWMASPKLGLPEGKLTPKDLQRWPVIALSRENPFTTRPSRTGSARARPLPAHRHLQEPGDRRVPGRGRVGRHAAAAALLRPGDPVGRAAGDRDRPAHAGGPSAPPHARWTALQPVARHIVELARQISDFEKTDNLERAAE